MKSIGAPIDMQKMKVPPLSDHYGDTISIIRKESLAHNDFNKSNQSVSVPVLIKILDEVCDIFNHLCFSDIDDRVAPVTDKYKITITCTLFEGITSILNSIDRG